MTTRELPRSEFDAAYDLWFKTVGSMGYPKSFWEFLGRDSIISYSKRNSNVLLSEEQLNRIHLINSPHGTAIIKAYVAQQADRSQK